MARTIRERSFSRFLSLVVSGFLLLTMTPIRAAGEDYSHGTSTQKLEAEIARLEADTGSETSRSLARLGAAYRELAQATGDPRQLDRAADAFIRAAELGFAQGRVLYTREISELLVEQGNWQRLNQVFEWLLSLPSQRDPGGHYLALVDFADGLLRLEDERGWEYFEQALESDSGNHREALHRYTEHLMERGRDEDALELLEGLSSEQRLRHFAPVFQRREALERLGRDTTDAEQEIEILRQRMDGSMGMRPETQSLKAFAHSSVSDDCRNAATATNCTPDGFGNCFYTVAINVAEVLWNEARGERIGAQDMVGWTIRDRSFQSLSCDSYPGAQGNGLGNSCRAAVPCSDPNFCTESRKYCCVVHGGYTTIGRSHEQFNDGHVSFSNLVSSGLIYEAVYVMNGWVPELSTGYVAPGVFTCSFSCDSPFCYYGSNVTSPSPSGPHEFKGNNNCAHSSTLSCKTYVKNVCGQLSIPPNLQCSAGGYAGDNFFWNRKP